MNDHTIQIRRAILRLNIGDSITLKYDGITTKQVIADASRFAKARKIIIEASETPDGALIKRIESAPKINLYPEIDALEVGQSHLFKYPKPMHQRVRVAATSRNRTGTVRLSCIVDGEHIRVIRLPLTEQEHEACGDIQIPARSSKYGLERLETERSISFNIPRTEQSALRLDAHRKGVMTGWTIRCRLQDDGSMLVYRTDPGAPA